MNICPECPNPAHVERTGKCFECIDGEEPLDTEEEIANAPQHGQPKICPVCFEEKPAEGKGEDEALCVIIKINGEEGIKICGGNFIRTSKLDDVINELQKIKSILIDRNGNDY